MKYEYATTTIKADAAKAAEIVPVQPQGRGWEMCGSNAVPGARHEYYEDEGREFAKSFATIRVLWFWKREVP